MNQKKIDLNLLIDFSEVANKELKSPVSSTIHLGKTLPSDFKILKKLAKGGYGEVYVVERNKKIYAMKKVSKQLVLKNKNSTFFMNEKELMTSHELEWLVKSSMCLQDDSHLYYIMEFIHGGDLLGYLSKKDILKEGEIKFYAAEIFTAINEMHKTGWIHRDLKPDNILLDRDGHIKLADFGSCIKMTDNKVISSSTVGTPDYISPDVLSSTGETVIYGPEVDYWTVGVILFEMFYGITPFYSNSLRETYSKIQNIDFKFEEGISEDFKDLIGNLICEKVKRFDFKKVKEHRFFKDIKWEDLRKIEPPFKPRVSSDEDISNFIDTEFNPDTDTSNGGYIDFVGFTYDPDHTSKIFSDILETYGCNKLNNGCNRLNNMSSSDENINNLSSSGETLSSNNNVDSTNINSSNNELESLNREIKCKNNELNDLKNLVNDLLSNKEDLSSQLTNISLEISKKKAISDQLQIDIKNFNENLKNNKLVSNLDQNNNISKDLINIIKSIQKFNFREKLDEIQEIAYWFYIQCQNLEKELKINSQDITKNKSLEELKKQLRIQKSEIREYEQKIENEIVIRKKLEEEIKTLKKALKEASKSFNNFRINVLEALTNKEIEITIENGIMKVNNKEHFINMIYVRELKNNELHHLPEKRRSLSLQMYFLKESISGSSSSATRRSLKALEKELEKEEKILKGIVGLLPLLEGKSKEEADLQLKGSKKKIEQMKVEIEKAKKTTIVENCIDDSEIVHEFNSHLFSEITVAKGTLCEHCNEVLYGIVNQAYCCKDCLLVVHKCCYVLVDISCELNKAIKHSTSLPVVCKTSEDKNKLLNLNKVI